MSMYVGMDVHRKRSQVAVVDAAGVPQRNRNVPNDPAKLVPILGALPPGTPVAFEAAYGWGWLGRVSRIPSWPVGSGAQPDEDVGHGHRGLVADGELVKAGRDRPELLAAVHQPLHLVPGAIADPVEGRRAATTSTLTDPVGLLVPTLRDGVADVAGPQGGPVGPTAVGLVPGQMLRSHPRPAAAARPRHPYGVHQPDQLASAGILARREPGRQVATAPVADRMELGGQPAS